MLSSAFLFLTGDVKLQGVERSVPYWASLLILVTVVIIFILGASLLKTVLVRVSGDFLLYWISPSNLHYMLST